MRKFKTSILKYAFVVGGLAVVPTVMTSCRQELDINVDPNNPTPETVSINYLLSSSQAGLGYYLGGEAARVPAAFVQHYAGHRAQPLDHSQYKIVSSDTSNLWGFLYKIAYDLEDAQTRGEKSGELVQAGVAKLLQAYTLSVLTDLFGDIPYTEALQGTKNITPAYDKQEQIYDSLIALIDEGVNQVQSGKGALPASSDLIYQGNISKWIKFGNSLKLRLLNHLNKVRPNAASQFLATNPNLIENYEDNAKIAFGSTAQNANPIYQFDVLSGRKDQAVASTIVEKMKSLNDPRVSVYFAAIKKGNLAGQYIGNIPGNDEEDTDESRYSRVGSAYASINSPVMLLSAAEVNFIKAEINFKAGNQDQAKIAYEAAITQDFGALNLSSNVNDYLTNANVAYNNTLERIMEQKWITMFQAPYESWVDWRRTGYPTLTPASVNFSNGQIPRRLPYPTSEINLNAANLAAGPGIPVDFVTYLTKVWWDQ